MDNAINETIDLGTIPCYAPSDGHMVYMSVIEDGASIAFAAYNEKSNVIVLEKCNADGYEIETIAQRILSEINPTLALLSSKTIDNENLLNLLTKIPEKCIVHPRDSVDDGTDLIDDNDSNSGMRGIEQNISIVPARNIPYRLMKTSNYDKRRCMSNIMKLSVTSMTRGGAHQASSPTGQEEIRRQFRLASTTGASRHFKVSNYHYLASIVDFDSIVQIQALGSLVSFMHSMCSHLIDGGKVHVNDIIVQKSTQNMYLSMETLSSLQIFATEHHPIAASKGQGNSKEGLSLFSLLDRTKSRLGRQRLHEWMMKPLGDTNDIGHRQNGVELFSCFPEMKHPTAELVKFLFRVGAVDKIMVRIKKCCANPSDFLLLSKALSSAVAIADTLREGILKGLQNMQTCLPLVGEDQQCTQGNILKYVEFIESILERIFVDDLLDIFHRITDVIDEEKTFSTKAIIIRAGHDEQLDVCKIQFARLQETLESVGARLVERMPHLRLCLEVIFLPQVGFLVAVDNAGKWTEYNALPKDFVFVFSEGDKSFFKNVDVQHLDETIGDLDAFIKDIENLILAELEEEILDYENQIRKSFNAVADLDCILAFASCATDFNYVRPMLVSPEKSIIKIVNGRHPLQEFIVEREYTPNHTDMDHSKRIQIVTGPNFSGKSCYARQVGILVFMAHIGCFIPCEQATISLTDQIIARFSGTETCSVPQSSFQRSLTQMSHTLRQATPHSLVIIDEFGKGTTPSSGIALLAATLLSLSTKKSKVICTTHFLEIFTMELVRDGENGVRALNMAMQVSTHSDETVPLFSLQVGVASTSAGIECARKAGVKASVLVRAQEVISALRDKTQILPLQEITVSRSCPLFSEIIAVQQLVKTLWVEASEQDIKKFMVMLETS